MPSYFIGKDNSYDDSMYCSRCRFDSMTSKLEVFYTLPNVIFINFNYGKNITFKCHVKIPELLDLSDYFKSHTYLKLQSSPKIFRCIGVIAHKGISGDSGHYIAYCKHKSGWICYDDSKVIPCDFENTMDVGDEQLIYCVFYEKV